MICVWDSGEGTNCSTASFLQDLHLSVACAANTVAAPLMKIQALDWLLQLLMNLDTSKFHAPSIN